MEPVAAILDDAPIGIAVVDRDGWVRQAIGAGAVAGIPVRSTPGKRADALWADLSPLLEAIDRARSGEHVNLDIEAHGAWWDLRISPRPGGVIIVSLEHTPRRRTIEREHRDLNFLDSLIENLPATVMVKDAADLRFVRINRAAEDLLGFKRQEMLGKNDYDFFPAEEADFFTDKDHAVLRSGTLLEIESEPVHTHHQDVRYLHTKKIPIYDAHGRPLYLLILAEDITERRQVDLERQTLERLRHELLANVSHEFRTPLTLMRAHLATLVQRDANNDDDRTDLSAIGRGIDDLLVLVNDLLDLARAEAGKLNADYAVVDVGHLVRQVVAGFEIVARPEEIQLIVEAPPTTVELDIDRIQRVLTNLIANAIRHTPRGGRVRCTVSRDDDRVRIVVADSGPGIPVEQRQRVFERFYQGGPPGHGGVGLGLAVVQELVTLHRGTVTIDDAPEGGARFTVELPASAAAGVEVRREPAQELVTSGTTLLGVGLPPRRPHEARTEGPLVLIVEDHQELSRTIGELVGEHYRVRYARDGTAGLALARELGAELDLVITDLMMPNMSGEELVAAMREDRALASVPILILSAKAEETTRVRLLKEGAQDFVTKPFAPDELLARAHNLITLKRTRDVLASELEQSRGSVAELAEELARRTRQARFLADATLELSQTLDFQATLAEIAKVAVPEVADSCNVVVLGPDATVQQSSSAGYDVEVPLVARGRQLGAIRLGWQTPSHPLASELDLAHALATRAALAIDNARLYREAQAAIGLRDEFLSIASHELRTPLMPLVLAMQTLADGKVVDGTIQRKLIDTAARQVDRLTALVEELLDATRIDTGEIALSREQLDLGELAATMLARWKPQLARAGCVASLECTGPVVGEWDRTRLEQVIGNLLTNALKFAARAPIEVEVGYVGGRARLAVRDHGIGIPLERQERIFDRFERAVDAHHYGGLGLGLYISRKIAVAHGGTLSVESRPGDGATFTLELPP